MNDLEILKRTDITNKFFNVIKLLDNNVSLDYAVKWKEYEHQLCIGTKDYFYKVYTIDKINGKFQEKIREKLAEIYKEEFGIHWLIKTIEYEGILYQIEQREILKVITPEMMSYKELLQRWSSTLEILEEKLKLKILTKELQKVYQDVYKLKIIRDCVNKYQDYGITNNGNVVLLDDSDFFIAMIDKDGNWLSKKTITIDCFTIIGDSYFAPIDWTLSSNKEEFIDRTFNKWNIYVNNEENHDINILTSNKENMIQNNIKLLSTGECNNLIVNFDEQIWSESYNKILEITHE